MILSLVLALGLVLGAWQGIAYGVTRGRDKERLQVIAFLMTRSNAGEENAPDALARRVARLEHHDYDIRPREPRGPRAA